MRAKDCLLLSLILATALVVTAQEDDVVVTATRMPRMRSKVPASVTMIDSKKLKTLPARNLDDLLQSESGVFVLRTTGMGGGLPSQINFRGIPGQHSTLLLIDNMPLNEGISGYLGINELPLNAIDHIEVVRGPFSNLYGTDAFGGVIHAFTPSPENLPNVSASYELGNEDLRAVSFQCSAGTEKLGIIIDADKRDTDNYLGRDDVTKRFWIAEQGQFIEVETAADNYDYEEERLFLKAVMQAGSAHKIALQGRYLKSELGYGITSLFPLIPVSAEDSMQIETGMGGLEWQFKANNKVSTVMRAYYREQSRETIGLDMARLMPSISRAENEDWKIEGAIELTTDAGHTIYVAADFWQDDADFSPPMNPVTAAPFLMTAGREVDADNLGVYLQDEIPLGDSCTVVAGVRIDEHSTFGSAVSPKVGLSFDVNDQLVVRTSLGRAFRAPSLLELYQPDVVFGNITFSANPELNPEYVVSADIGIDYMPADNLTLRADVFGNDMADLIGKRVEGASLSFDNVTDAWSAGLEFGADWQANDAIAINADATWQQTEDQETDMDLEHMPELMLGLGLHAKKQVKNVQLSCSLTETYVGERGYVDFASGVWVEMDDYWRADVAIKGSMGNTSWIGVSVENLFDELYQESPLMVHAPGRLYSVTVGIEY